MGDEVFHLDDSNVSETDRKEILEQIDEIVARHEYSGEIEVIKPRKKGVALPITLNVLAVMIVVGAFFGARWLGDQREIDMSLASREYASAEGRLIAEIRRESEAKIRQKEAEIEEIQSELSRLDSERERLKEESEAELARRESEYRQVLQTQISLERTRLEALGRSETDIDDRLAELEASLRADQQAELSEYRQAAAAELEAKDSELQRTRELTQQVLDEAQAAREELQARSEAREQEIIERYEAEKLELEEQTTAAQDELRRISAARSRESLIADQINGTYAVVKRHLEEADYATASADLEQLRKVLLDPELDGVPAIAQRKDADLFVIDALNELVELRSSADEQKANETIIDTANLLYTSRSLVSRADELYEAGDFEAAKQRYREAMNMLPDLNRAVRRIGDIEQSEIDTRVSQALDRASAQISEGLDLTSVETYLEASLIGVRGTSARQAVTSLDETLRELLVRSEANAAAIETESGARISSLESTLAATERRLQGALADATALRSTLSRTEASLVRANETAANRSETIRELSATIEENNDVIASLEDDLASIRNRYSLLESERNGFVRSLAELQSRSSQIDADLESAKRNVASLETEKRNLSAANDELADDLEEALTDLESTTADLTARENELARLRAELTTSVEDLEDAETELATSRIALARSEAQAGDLRTRLTEAASRIEALETDADTLEAEIATLESGLRESEDRYALSAVRSTTLENELNELSREYESLKETSVTMAELSSVYDRYAAPVEASLQSRPVAYSEASLLFMQLLGKLDERWFPGLATVGSVTVEGRLEEEREAASDTARRSSLNEVLRYLDYAQSDSVGGLTSRIAFEALSSKDLLYGRVFSRIDSALGRISDTVLRQIGGIVGFDSGIIEVALDDAEPGDIEPGTTVVVRRDTGGGSEQTVAQGSITAVEDSVVFAEIRMYLDENLPSPGDRVYIETK